MATPNKYFYKFAENKLVDSAGTEITADALLPQITLGQKPLINVQLVNDDMTKFTGLAGGTTAQLMVDTDFKNDALPVPLGASGWTNSIGSEYRKYLAYDPDTVFFGGTAGSEGTAGSLSAGSWDYDATTDRIYIRLPDSGNPASKADNYITAEFDVADPTPPYIECYSDSFNTAGSWWDDVTDSYRNPDITDGELAFALNANTANYYQRIGVQKRAQGSAQMQFYAGAENIANLKFTMLLFNRITGSGESAAVLELDGIGYYTKTEADSRFVRLDVADAYPELALFSTSGTFYFESATGGSFALPASKLPGSAGGEVNTASNVGAGAGIYKEKVAADLRFKSLVAGTNVTITPGTDTVTIAASGTGGGVSSFNTQTGAITLAASGSVALTNTAGSFHLTGSGMLASVYDPTSKAADAFNSANHAYTGELTATNTQAAINELDLERVYTQTGWIDAPLLSVNGGDNTKFDISAGVGVVVDWADPTAPTFTRVEFAGATAQTATYLATAYATGIMISDAGAIVQNAGVTVPAQYRTYLFVGDLLHSSQTQLDGVQNKPLLQWDSISGLRDLSLAIGTINTSGNVYSANGTNLQIKKTSGIYYRAGVNYSTDSESPNYVTNAAVAPITSFLYGYRNGSGGWIYTAGTVIVPGSYDDGDGTLGTVGNANYTIQRIYNFPNSNQTIILYGQKVYSSLSNAITGLRDSFDVDPNLRDASLRATLIIKGNATDLSDTATAVFYAADKFGNVSGGASGGTATGDHNDLTGLQGGTSGEYYHLTAARYGALNSGTLTASRTAQINASGQIEAASVTTTELGYVSGVTSAIQTQLGNKAASGANSDITSLSGLTTALSVAQGGTGATTAAGARTNLGTAPIDHASTAGTYGVASSTNYGHIQLATATPQPTGTAAVGTSSRAAREDHVHASSSSGGVTSALVTCHSNAAITVTAASPATLPIGATDGTGQKSVIINPSSILSINTSNQIVLAAAGRYLIEAHINMNTISNSPYPSIGFILNGTFRNQVSSTVNYQAFNDNIIFDDITTSTTNGTLAIGLYAALNVQLLSGISNFQDGLGAGTGYKPYMQIRVTKIS